VRAGRVPGPRGFTLVEVLVVIAIIAVLCAILFPVMSAAREKSRQTVCASNIRQVGVALRMYADDCDGMLPPATTQIPGGHFSTPWQGQLDIVWWDLVLPYMRDERVLYCPSAKHYLPTYRINDCLTFVQPGWLDACTEPTETLLLVEDWVPDEPGEAVSIPVASSFRPDLIEEMTAPFRHAGKMNVCFADIHVKVLGPSQVVAGSPLWDVVK